MINLTVFPNSLRANTQILCINQDQATADLLAELFTQAGYDADLIDNARSAYQATQYLIKNSYDIVLVDLDLPDISGKDVVRNFVSYYPDIPFVALIGNDDYERLVASSLGIAGWIAKPIYKEGFVEVVEQLCQSFSGYDIDEQTAVDLYATEAAERLLEQTSFIHWFATQFNQQFGHFMELSDTSSEGDLLISNAVDRQAYENLRDMMSVSSAVAHSQVNRRATEISDLIDSVMTRLGNHYQMTYKSQAAEAKINIDPHVIGLALAYICQICQGNRFHWEFESEHTQTTIRITSADTPYMSENHSNWLMIQPLLRLHQAKMTRTCEAIQISVPN